MKDKAHQARIAALSIAQCTAIVQLLRSHELQQHAANVETALEAVVSILSREFGQEQFAEAMDWVSNEAGTFTETPDPLTWVH